ncbi:hypothetical protein ABIC65_002031 [Sphingomonas trueperi]|uniref:hypothetical protein n=1 Tax=Sphingomonas trueperi TaxID=53317 RepID=UPI0033993803
MITTLVPPAADPDVGAIEVTVGVDNTTVLSEAFAVFDAPPPDNCTEGVSGLEALLAKFAFSVIVGPEPALKAVVRVHEPVWPDPLQLHPEPEALE